MAAEAEELEDDFDYGTHETLILETGDEAELAISKALCPKSHDRFVEVDSFTNRNLPSEYREDGETLVDLIRALCDLTVKIDLNYVTKDRPSIWKGIKNSSYPLHDRRGRAVSSSGSGRVADVRKLDKESFRCPCKECSNDIGRQNWMILVFTATHVIYNTEEAENAVCVAFFDKRNTGIRFPLVETQWRNETGDLCLLAGVTCNPYLKTRLWDSILKFNASWKEIEKRCEESKEKRKKKLVVIVSHPHGAHKQISVSSVKEERIKHINNDTGCFYSYKASTCQGSSGAPVYIYGQNYFADERVHSGTVTDKSLNYCTTWCPKKKQN
ncbi:hypothetical protein BgiMline_031589 [Biomphalaria glabrata]|nr:hypothetical protein BgiMline_019803 [Biomphalaria glabrata]